MKKILALILGLGLVTAAQAAEQSVFDFEMTGLNGKPLVLEQFRGKAVLLVNTASECGFTPQYDGLETLWKTYKDQGLVIIGVPSNEFGGQEPGKAGDIAQFCKLNYGVSFPMGDKAEITGSAAIPLYAWANAQAGFFGKPKWNFHKYLFDRQGKFVTWYASTTEPMSEKLVGAVQDVLK